MHNGNGSVMRVISFYIGQVQRLGTMLHEYILVAEADLTPTIL
jgi:hypothetical protein